MDGGQRRQEADRLDEGKHDRPRVQPPAAESDRCAAVTSFPVNDGREESLSLRVASSCFDILLDSDCSRSLDTSGEMCLQLRSRGKERSEVARVLALA